MRQQERVYAMFFKKDKPATEQTEETSKSNIWGTQLASALADARKGSMENEQGIKGKRKSASKADSGAGVSRELEEAARKMFDPEAWRAIVRAPFAFGKALTGRKCWDLEKTQEDTLATSTSATAEYFLQTDPKWVCLTIFAFNWSVILTEKFVANEIEKKKELASEAQTPLKVV